MNKQWMLSNIMLVGLGNSRILNNYAQNSTKALCSKHNELANKKGHTRSR